MPPSRRRMLWPLLLWSLGAWTSAAGAAVLVLVDEGEGRSVAFASILDGIRDASADAEIRLIGPDGLPPALAAADARDGVIVLGRALLERPLETDPDAPVLLGGFSGTVDALPTRPRVSLNIDPAYALAQIEKTGPAITRLSTVLPPRALTRPDIVRLAALPGVPTKRLSVASGERAVARAWFDTIATVEGPEEALWVVDDDELDGSGTYRYLVERAWREDRLVVSIVPRYASRGVAIGFIPDLPAYGRLLVRSVRRLAEDPGHVPEPLLGAGTVRRVFNRRTLEHIGRRLPDDLDREGRDDVVIE